MKRKANDLAGRVVETLEAFGGVIRELREAGGWTLEEVAGASGISKPYLSNMEHGRTPGPAREEKLRALEKALGVKGGVLVGMGNYLRTPVAVRKLLKGKIRVSGFEFRETEGAAVPRRGDGSVDLDRLVGGKKFRVSGFEFQEAGEAGRGESEIGDLKFQIGDLRSPRGDQGSETGGSSSSLETRNSTLETAFLEARNLKLETPLSFEQVPIINKVPAGNAVGYTHLDYPAGVADEYVAVPGAGTHPETGLAVGQFAVRVEGDSMLPVYMPGDIVVAADVPMRNGEDCVVRLGEGEDSRQTLKRVFVVPAERDGVPTQLRLVPLNPRHAERTVDREVVMGVFPVLWKISRVRG
jgi:transcriptional regulator with XRE-family HTH domain/SOS-response transcriptional repressor LexA